MFGPSLTLFIPLLCHPVPNRCLPVRQFSAAPSSPVLSGFVSSLAIFCWFFPVVMFLISFSPFPKLAICIPSEFYAALGCQLSRFFLPSLFSDRPRSRAIEPLCQLFLQGRFSVCLLFLVEYFFA